MQEMRGAGQDGVNSRASRKARGAFFTPPEIADYLSGWAVRSADDTVFEPSCGEAAFLLAAARRLKTLGAKPARWSERLHGVEIFEASARTAGTRLRGAGFDARVSVGDFFAHKAPAAYDAVVGNPPFVRYQAFSGPARTRALEAALAQGVRLSGLASSWAAFVVKAALHVAPGGRLALVLPAELMSVGYAREVRRFLLRRFGRVRLVAFEERVFPDVLEEVVLLLAEGGGGGSPRLEVCQARNARALAPPETADWTAHDSADGDKWTPALVARGALSVFHALSAERFEPLRVWGGAYLGAVTGANRFFALSAAAARARGLDENDTVRIAPGGRRLPGPVFDDAAWERLAAAGAPCLLFSPRGRPSEAARRYIAEGARAGVAEAYKCRVRAPWWRAPTVDIPDLILTYMNYDCPRAAGNAARAHILNSVYGMRFAPERRALGTAALPVACLNSVTLLGAELVGRAYGGGLLKMEPREADALPVPAFASLQGAAAALRALEPRLARPPRGGDLRGVVEAVDAIVLAGVPSRDAAALREARAALFRRRRARGKHARH